MSFRSRLLAVGAALVILVAALLLGIVFSPQRVAQRSAGTPLVSMPVSALVTGVELYARASDKEPAVTLKASGPNQWEAVTGGSAYPASSDRVSSLLQGLRDMRRGSLVTREPARRSELGLDDDTAHMIVLRTQGGQATALLLGKRAASGDEEYAMVRGEPSAWLARSSVGILLEQDRSYWYDLRVLPEDIQADTILSVRVSGSVKVGARASDVLSENYALLRERSGQQAVWRIDGQTRPVNPAIATAMTDRLADIEGTNFYQPLPAEKTPAGGGLEIQVVAINGDRYILRITQGLEPGSLLLTTSWSPWSYVVDGLTLSRTIFPLPDLLGR